MALIPLEDLVPLLSQQVLDTLSTLVPVTLPLIQHLQQDNHVWLGKIEEDFDIKIPTDKYQENWKRAYDILYAQGASALTLSNNVSLVEIALHNGFNVSYNSNFPFRYACGNGNLKVVELLLSYHATDPSDKDNHAIRLASENGHFEVVKLLLSHGVDPSSKNNYAIEHAFENDHVHVVNLLREHLYY
jgi:ankyrin repeat protein